MNFSSKKNIMIIIICTLAFVIYYFGFYSDDKPDYRSRVEIGRHKEVIAKYEATGNINRRDLSNLGLPSTEKKISFEKESIKTSEGDWETKYYVIDGDSKKNISKEEYSKLVKNRRPTDTEINDYLKNLSAQRSRLAAALTLLNENYEFNNDITNIEFCGFFAQITGSMYQLAEQQNDIKSSGQLFKGGRLFLKRNSNDFFEKCGQDSEAFQSKFFANIIEQIAFLYKREILSKEIADRYINFGIDNLRREINRLEKKIRNFQQSRKKKNKQAYEKIIEGYKHRINILENKIDVIKK